MEKEKHLEKMLITGGVDEAENSAFWHYTAIMCGLTLGALATKGQVTVEQVQTEMVDIKKGLDEVDLLGIMLVGLHDVPTNRVSELEQASRTWISDIMRRATL